MRHAFLVMMYKNEKVVNKFIKLYDDENFDYYIHIDKKSNLDKSIITDGIKHSKIYFITSIPIYWGHDNCMKAELKLMASAVKKKYDYYHLISESCFPIKNKEEFKSFFDQNNGYEFISIDSINKIPHIERFQYYYPLQKYVKSGNKYKNYLISYIQIFLIKIQKIFKIRKFKNIDFTVYKGDQWFSITNKCVEYVLSKNDFIEKYFFNSYCIDEVFLQTIVGNSSLKSRIYKFEANEKSNLRLIDWNRGLPYVWREVDFDILKKSNCLIARKFDPKVDNEIINHLFQSLKANNI